MAEPLAWLSHCLRALQVTTLGYDGHLGTEQPLSRLVIALALICGLLFTTMPITVLGGAFAAAWEQKEVVEVAMKVQELLIKHGRSEKDVKLVFDAFDADGSRELDWQEFKVHISCTDTALCTLAKPLPIKLRLTHGFYARIEARASRFGRLEVLSSTALSFPNVPRTRPPPFALAARRPCACFESTCRYGRCGASSPSLTLTTREPYTTPSSAGCW